MKDAAYYKEIAEIRASVNELRDRFAMAALAASDAHLYLSPLLPNMTDAGSMNSYKAMATAAYALADAMLLVREQPSEFHKRESAYRKFCDEAQAEWCAKREALLKESRDV